MFTDAQLVGRQDFVPFVNKRRPLLGNKVAAKGEEAWIDGSFQLRERGFEGFVPKLGVQIGHTVDDFQGRVNTICIEIQVGNTITTDKQVFEKESDRFIIVVFHEANVSRDGNILDVFGDGVVKIILALIQLKLVGHLRQRVGMCVFEFEYTSGGAVEEMDFNNVSDKTALQFFGFDGCGAIKVLDVTFNFVLGYSSDKGACKVADGDIGAVEQEFIDGVRGGEPNNASWLDTVRAEDAGFGVFKDDGAVGRNAEFAESEQVGFGTGFSLYT